MSRRTILFGLIIAFSVVFGFISFHNAPLQAVSLVGRYGYWEICAVAVLFGFCLVRSLRGEGATLQHGWRQWAGPLGLVLAATAFLQTQEPHEFKIVMDEVVLQTTAMDMHFHRSAFAVVRGYDFAGNFTALQVYVDKRPLFFPFLLSCLHDLTGFRLANAFVLNGLLSLALTGLMFLTGRRLGGAVAGVAAVLLLVSIPLVHQNAVGSGFELLNMVMILATLWLGMRYAEQPDTDRFGAFIFSGILLTQTRYESALFILPVGLVILHSWWRRRTVDLSWPVLVAPLALVVVPLHFNVFKVADISWQLADRPGAATPFSPVFFYDNVGHALNFFLSLDGSHGNAPLIFLLGVIGVGFFMLVFYREHREILSAKHPDRAVICVFIFGLLAHTGLMLCYFWGQFDDPIIRRLSLPSHLLFIVAFLFVFPKLVAHAARWRGLLITTGVFILWFTIPSVAMHRYNNENFAARTNQWISEFIDGLGNESILAIDNGSALQWLLHRQSSVSIDNVMKRPEAYVFHFKNHSFKHYFVVQRMGADFDNFTKYPTMDDSLGDGFSLETVAERSFSPVYWVRISRVVSVDEKKIESWSKARTKAVQLTPTVKQELQKADAEKLDRWFMMLP